MLLDIASCCGWVISLCYGFSFSLFWMVLINLVLCWWVARPFLVVLSVFVVFFLFRSFSLCCICFLFCFCVVCRISSGGGARPRYYQRCLSSTKDAVHESTKGTADRVHSKVTGWLQNLCMLLVRQTGAAAPDVILLCFGFLFVLFCLKKYVSCLP